MGMLKGNSNTLNFDQLMKQATQVAVKQDASLMERARQKRKEEEDKRRREERLTREKQEAQAQLARKRELEDKKYKQQAEQQKKQPKEKKVLPTANKSTKSKNAFSNLKRGNSFAFSEKKQPVNMSFDDLMKKAKEQSSKPNNIKKPSSDNNTPSLYHQVKRPELSAKTSTSSDYQMSARDRARQSIAEPPKKVVSQKKDRRSISEIQREFRHNRGVHSDDEDHSRDPRLMKNKSLARKRPNSPPRISKRPPAEKRPPPAEKRLPEKRLPEKRLPEKRPPPAEKRLPHAPIRRMPFSGKLLDPAARRAATNRQRYRDEEEEEDEDLKSFIVDDDDDDDIGYARSSHRNSYSDEIRKIFKYDRNKYINDPVHSDDDMEADASDVLREEKRSERIARREDYLEEQKELERLERIKKRKKNDM